MAYVPDSPDLGLSSLGLSKMMYGCGADLVHLVVVDENSGSVLCLELKLRLLSIYDGLSLGMGLSLGGLVGQSSETPDLIHKGIVSLSRITHSYLALVRGQGVGQVHGCSSVGCTAAAYYLGTYLGKRPLSEVGAVGCQLSDSCCNALSVMQMRYLDWLTVAMARLLVVGIDHAGSVQKMVLAASVGSV